VRVGGTTAPTAGSIAHVRVTQSWLGGLVTALARLLDQRSHVMDR
jgi:hypothetical protein